MGYKLVNSVWYLQLITRRWHSVQSDISGFWLWRYCHAPTLDFALPNSIQWLVNCRCTWLLWCKPFHLLYDRPRDWADCNNCSIKRGSVIEPKPKLDFLTVKRWQSCWDRIHCISACNTTNNTLFRQVVHSNTLWLQVFSDHGVVLAI